MLTCEIHDHCVVVYDERRIPKCPICAAQKDLASAQEFIDDVQRKCNDLANESNDFENQLVECQAELRQANSQTG